MQNVMGSERFFTPCIQFKHCEMLCIICGEQLNLDLFVGTPHISCSHLSSEQLSRSLSCHPSLSITRQYLLHVRNQAPLFITAPLLSLLHCFLHRTKCQPVLAKHHFTGPQAIDNHRAMPLTQY